MPSPPTLLSFQARVEHNECQTSRLLYV
uniref:Uncharacterized protein n=1 Tax=Nelumbo nucifera TaxID=4432 RepID=A0A822ZV06_NELNU|nr:TPA_asm: hypothetical protein HUJ06_018654 [Nelumbo nucifera]